MSHSNRVATLALGLAAWSLTTFGISTSARAQGFTPKSDELLSQATIRAGSATNSNRGQTLRLGIEQCRELVEDDDARFRFEFNQRVVPNPEAEADAAIFEFAATQGPSSSCGTEVPDDACSGVESSNDDVTINEGEQTFEVILPFELLQQFDDETVEPCTPPDERSSSENSLHSSTTVTRPQTNADAGMSDASGGDTSDVGFDAGPSDDTGTDTFADTTDTATDTRPTDDGGGATSGGSNRFDRLYVLRAFLQRPRARDPVTGTIRQERNFRVDGVIRLDRTRPRAPRGVSEALASENRLAVEFVVPSETDEVENYHVFYSDNPIDPNQSPAQLDDAQGVDRSILTSLKEDGDTRAGEVDINRSPGDQIYVAVASRDAAQNFSDVRALDQPVEVQESIDFWEKYLNLGGSEGGCRMAPTQLPPLGAWLLLNIGSLVYLGSRRRSDSGPPT